MAVVRKNSAVTTKKNYLVNEDTQFSASKFHTNYFVEGHIKVLTLALQLKTKQGKFYFQPSKPN